MSPTDESAPHRLADGLGLWADGGEELQGMPPPVLLQGRLVQRLQWSVYHGCVSARADQLDVLRPAFRARGLSIRALHIAVLVRWQVLSRREIRLKPLPDVLVAC